MLLEKKSAKKIFEISEKTPGKSQQKIQQTCGKKGYLGKKNKTKKTSTNL